MNFCFFPISKRVSHFFFSRFSQVMRACARSRHWNREAFTYFDRMLANGHDATVQTMTILIDACSLTGDVESAKKLFQAIDAHPEMEMNEYVYSAMLNTYARGMRPRKETKDHWAPPVLRNPRQGLPDGVKLGYQTDGTARDEHDEAETLHFLKGKRNNRPQIFQKYDAYDFARRKNDWSEHPAFDGLNSELLPEHKDPLMEELMMLDEEETPSLLSGNVESSGMLELDAMVPSETKKESNDVVKDDIIMKSVNHFLEEKTKEETDKETHPEKQKRYIEEARELFRRVEEEEDESMMSNPLLNSYLKVHSEALRLGTAHEIVDTLFDRYDLTPDRFTYVVLLFFIFLSLHPHTQHENVGTVLLLECTHGLDVWIVRWN